jgi:hypothetical protein
VGPVVWEMLVEGQTPEDVVRAVATRFDQNEGVIARDVQAFIADMEQKSLLVRDDGPG